MNKDWYKRNKAALDAWERGEALQCRETGSKVWSNCTNEQCINSFGDYEFRTKPPFPDEVEVLFYRDGGGLIGTVKGTQPPTADMVAIRYRRVD